MCRKCFSYYCYLLLATPSYEFITRTIGFDAVDSFFGAAHSEKLSFGLIEYRAEKK